MSVVPLHLKTESHIDYTLNDPNMHAIFVLGSFPRKGMEAAATTGDSDYGHTIWQNTI